MRWTPEMEQFVITNYIKEKRVDSLVDLQEILNNTFDTDFSYYAVQSKVRDLKRNIASLTIKEGNTASPIDNKEKFKAAVEHIHELNSLLHSSQSEHVKNDITIDMSTVNTRYFGVAFMSDVHLGSPHVDYKKLYKDVDKILSVNNMFIYLGGDLIDNFIVSALASANEEALLNIQNQWTLALEFLKHVKHRVLALGDGNHTAWTRTRALVDILNIFANELHILYTGNGAIIRLSTDNYMYKIYVAHKSWGMSRLNRHNAHKRLYDFLYDTVDVIVLEHYHETDSESFYKHGLKRVGINCGSYKSISDYNFSIGAFHASNEVPAVIFDTYERNIIWFDNGIDHGIPYLEYLHSTGSNRKKKRK